MHKPVVGILIKTATAGKDDKSNFSITQDGQLVGFLQQPIAALTEGHLPVCCVLYSLYLNFASSTLLLRRSLSCLNIGMFHSR